MTSTQLVPIVQVQRAGGDPLTPTGGDASLDASRVPYAAATVDLPLTPPVDPYSDFDPRDDVRVTISGSARGEWDSTGDTPVWVPKTPRQFDLGLRERIVDLVAKVLRLELASDEALLTDYATLVVDATPRTYETSLRALVNYVLSKIGAALQPGSTDADVTAYWAATNVHPNPLPASAVGYNIAANGTALTFTVLSGANVIRWTSSAATSNLNAGTTSAYRAQPGRAYYAAWDWASAAAGRSAALVMEFRSANGTVLMSRTTGTTLPYSAAFQTLTVAAEAPAGTETVYVYVTTTGNAAATQHYVKRFVLAETAYPVPFFYGGSSDADYTYAWTDAPSASPTTRTPLVARSPELFVWRPGVTAWEFLRPLLSSVSLKLFCDELRVWRLVDPAVYAVDGRVTVAGWNAVEATDTISREDRDVFATGIVVRYAWDDDDGIARTAHDVAGDPRKVVVIDYERAYPGPGAAAAILARRNGTGRTQAVTALTQWETTPGMGIVIAPPDTPEQEGVVQAVRFSLGDDALMDIGSRGLIDVPPESWLAVDDDLVWEAVADAVTWDTYTP